MQETDETSTRPKRSQWGGQPLALLQGRRLRPVLVVAGLLWGIFGFFRAGLLVASRNGLGDARADDLWRCILMGMRFDAIPVGYALIPLAAVLMIAPNVWFARERFRSLVAGYSTGIVALAFLAEVLGAAFYMQFGERLNYVAVTYMDSQEPMYYILTQYPVALLAGVMVVLIWGGYRLLKAVFAWGALPADGPLVRPVVLSALVVLCVLACRGGLGSHPLRQGKAYFSSNNILVQLSLNNFFTFTRAVISTLNEHRDEPGLYPFPPAREARETAARMLQGQHESILDPSVPLWRKMDTGRPALDCNVVVIIMEGMTGFAVGAMGNSPSETPNLDAICADGLFFDHVYAVGARTSRGLTGVLTGHPDLAGRTVLKQSRAVGRFLTLPGLFRDRGFRTLFFYGGDPDFDNMRSFFAAGGIEEFIGQRNIAAPPEEVSDWGVHDEYMLNSVHQKLLSMSDERFFAVVLTVSNHEPFDVPMGKTSLREPVTLRDKQINGIRYADWALGRFFEQARQAPYFQNTLFVLVADHGRGFSHNRLLDVPGYRVPFVVYAPGLCGQVPRGRIATVGSQTDVGPTLMGIVGGTYEHCFLGRNLLHVPPDGGFALLHEDDRLAWVVGEKVLVMPSRAKPMLFDLVGQQMVQQYPREGDNEVSLLSHRMLSYYFMACRLYLDGQYRAPEAQ